MPFLQTLSVDTEILLKKKQTNKKKLHKLQNLTFQRHLQEQLFLDA